MENEKHQYDSIEFPRTGIGTVACESPECCLSRLGCEITLDMAHSKHSSSGGAAI